MAGALSRSCGRLRGPVLRELLASADTVLFDCDGVIWDGERSLPGATELVAVLVGRGKQVFFVSNNCTRSRQQYLLKFGRLGFRGVRSEQIYSSAYCSAVYLKEVARLRGKVFVIGGEGVISELMEAGVPFVTGEEEEGLPGVGEPPEEGEQEVWKPPQEGEQEERKPVLLPGGPHLSVADCLLDPEVKAVLVGYDEKFSFLKLAKACCYLRDPDCLFLATDPDPWHPVRGGRITPGTGSLTAAVETATNRKATVVGKPSRFIFDCICSHFGADPSRTLMVGDRLESDVLFGASCGVTTVLTLTGVSRLEEALAHLESGDVARADLVPDYYVDSVADFLDELQD
ncbi:pyridoxal phosphate phosphatase [Latimeria chalumnae]|uniref:Pyridoxal phosphatase n=1 Tax=Latimeria chalumnae TaxID=7897 RepID=H3AI08_LATCH|nr:PREDICTED: pyridoxal phosphate phosphatase [Latimeria chalumnae]|eukprot:XP_006010611.1 PREDICTED: pyridoxal phosphate phosphatase [Latimeria chalumnae]